MLSLYLCHVGCGMPRLAGDLVILLVAGSLQSKKTTIDPKIGRYRFRLFSQQSSGQNGTVVIECTGIRSAVQASREENSTLIWPAAVQSKRYVVGLPRPSLSKILE